MKTWHWIAIGGAGVALFFLVRYQQQHAVGSVRLQNSSPFLSDAQLPDPSSVPLGTRVGSYVLRQSRQAGSAPYWSYETGGYTGGTVAGVS